MIPLEPLRVQFRETIRADGTVQQERLAFCPKVAGWVSLARCKACDACAHLSGDSEPILICSVAAVDAGAPESIRALLARSVWCIEENAPARLACLMPMSQADAIVIDGDGHAIGLLARQTARRAAGDVVARSVMEPAVVALFDGAPVGRPRDRVRRRRLRRAAWMTARVGGLGEHPHTPRVGPSGGDVDDTREGDDEADAKSDRGPGHKRAKAGRQRPKKHESGERPAAEGEHRDCSAHR
jgi:hypothetical protein